MSASRSVPWLLLLVILCSLHPRTAGAQPNYCRDSAVDRDVTAAAHDQLDAGRLEALWSRFGEHASGSDPGCNGRVAFCVGRKLALTDLDRAYALLDKQDLTGARTLLKQAKTRGSPWQVLVALGEVDATLARQSQDAELFREAASSLQFALNEADDTPLCPDFGEQKPEPERLARTRKEAQEIVMLAPSLEVTRTRSGECGGIFLEVSRGIQAEPVPVPITFAYDKSVPTDEGRKAVSALLECLKSNSLREITLSGHTDKAGGDRYNMDLSARRLAEVQSELKAGGFTGIIHLLPKGEREPFKPDDAGQYSQAEIDQMNRRVELRDTRK
ncbi:MAG: OmpA family protein [Parafilimonas terrae]|nr:OmpA family protein [Parafilimonas terrae]